MSKVAQTNTVVSILKQLKALRMTLLTDSERKAWRYTWNSTIDLARALDVLRYISEDILRV